CAPLVKFLEPFYAEQELANWANEKFSMKIDPMEFVADQERRVRKPIADIIKLIEDRAREAYAQREIEYPIDHKLAQVYSQDASMIEDPYRNDEIRNWAFARYHTEFKL